MPSKISLVEKAAPPWARPLTVGPGQWRYLVAPPLPSGAAVAAVDVSLWVEQAKLRASEHSPGTRYPPICPELHINSDSSFCLGRYSFAATDPERIAAFWQALGEFVVNQDYAERRGFWPAGRWLSHGPEAADQQVVAEQAAAEAGWSDEYAAWLEAGEGWLSQPLPSVHPKTRRLVLHGEGCPRGCTNSDGAAIALRRCPQRSRLTRLIVAESRRRAAQDDFFAALRAAGKRCCGRVAGCGLIGQVAA